MQRAGQAAGQRQTLHLVALLLCNVLFCVQYVGHAVEQRLLYCICTPFCPILVFLHLYLAKKAIISSHNWCWGSQMDHNSHEGKEESTALMNGYTNTCKIKAGIQSLCRSVDSAKKEEESSYHQLGNGQANRRKKKRGRETDESSTLQLKQVYVDHRPYQISAV